MIQAGDDGKSFTRDELKEVCLVTADNISRFSFLNAKYLVETYQWAEKLVCNKIYLTVIADNPLIESSLKNRLFMEEKK